MKKALRIGIFLGILAFSWMFFLLEEELAFYGIYTLIDYRVHEIAAIIPMLAIPATVIFLVIEIVSIVKKKGEKRKMFGRAEFHKDSVVLSELSFMKGSACIAYNCPNCKKIIIDYADGSNDLNGGTV